MPRNVIIYAGSKPVIWGDAAIAAPPPPAAVPQLSLIAGAVSPTVGVAATGWSVSNTGTLPALATVTVPGDVTSTFTNGQTVAAGANVAFALTALVSGAKSIALTSATAGAVITGSPATLTGVSAPPPPPPPSGTTITSLTLNAPTTATHPWAAGHAFRQGDLAAGASLAGVQCNVLTTWPDGSAKFAVLAGSTAMTGTVDAAVALTTGTAPSGTTLTTAGLSAVTAIIAGSVSGSATFSGSDWTTPLRTVATGPVMSQWVFRKTIDATLHAYCEVRLWASGAIEVLPWLENGYVLVAGTTSRNETWTFDLGGTQRESFARDFSGRTRLVLITGTKMAHWVGSDPAVVARHNTTYLRATKLVPNHTAASTSANVTSWVDSITTPQEQGRYPAGMGTAGAHESIGLLPQWDAMYLTLGDTKTWRVVQQQGYRAGRWAVHYRDENTLRPAQATLHPTRVLGNGAIGDVGNSSTGSTAAAQTGTLPDTYKVSHHPSMGFMAALVSGRWFHVETTQFLASINGLFQSDSYRTWTGGVMAYRTFAYMQPRGVAWAIRTLGQAIAITPTSDPMRAEFENHMAGTVSHNHARYVAQTSNPLGMMTEYNPDGIIPIPAGPFIGQTFMQNFIVASMGYARHLTADAVEGVKFAAWFTWAGQSVTGRLGINPATEYLYRDAENPYQWVLSTTTSPNWTNGTGPWVPTWSDVWTETAVTVYAQAPLSDRSVYHGYTIPYTAAPAKELGDGSLRGGGIGNPQNYWHNFMPALAYCVEFGLSGAQVGYERVTGANNFASGVTSQDAAFPHWGVRPRGFEWAAALPTDTWSSLTGTGAKAWAVAGGIPAGAYLGTDPLGQMFTAYCDPAHDEINGIQYFYGGGHGDSTCNAVVKLDWRTSPPSYSLVGLPTPPTKYPPNYVDETVSNPFRKQAVYPSGLSQRGHFLPAPPLTDPADTPYATPRARASSHMYGAAVLVGTKIHYLYLGYGEFDTATGTWADVSAYDFNADLIGLSGSLAPSGPITALDVGTSAIYDEVTGRIYATLNSGDNSGAGRNGILQFNPATRDCEAYYQQPSVIFSAMQPGASWTRVGRKIYCFKREQTSFDAPSVQRRGWIFDMDTKTFQWFTLTGDDVSDSTHNSINQETLPCVWDGANFWRWNFTPTAKRNQLLKLDLTPVSGTGTTADPFLLTQTVRPISGTLAGNPVHFWKRLIALRPGLLVMLNDYNQPLVAVKLS